MSVTLLVTLFIVSHAYFNQNALQEHVDGLFGHALLLNNSMGVSVLIEASRKEAQNRVVSASKKHLIEKKRVDIR